MENLKQLILWEATGQQTRRDWRMAVQISEGFYSCTLSNIYGTPNTLSIILKFGYTLKNNVYHQKISQKDNQILKLYLKTY